MKILFFPDVNGKISRQALVKMMPKYKAQYKPDLVIANVENLAHGIGVTLKTLDEISDIGIDCFTSGNHIFGKCQNNLDEIFAKCKKPLLRPANYTKKYPGKGETLIKTKDGDFLVINLLGQVFIEEKDVINPFKTLDKILDVYKDKKLTGIFVDFHAEATSEKKAMGFYADGRISAIVGTHTHVATADEEILTKGTAYISDGGMVGAKDSIIGVVKELVLDTFLENKAMRIDIPKTGEVIINAILISIDPKTKKALLIKHVDKKTKIS